MPSGRSHDCRDSPTAVHAQHVRSRRRDGCSPTRSKYSRIWIERLRPRADRVAEPRRVDGAVLASDAGGNLGQLGDASAVVVQVAHDLVQVAPGDLLAQHLPHALLRFAHQRRRDRAPTADRSAPARAAVAGCARQASSPRREPGRCAPAGAATARCAARPAPARGRRSGAAKVRCGRSGSAMRRSRPASGPGSSGALRETPAARRPRARRSSDHSDGRKTNRSGPASRTSASRRERHAIGGVTGQVHERGHRQAVARVLQQRRNAVPVDHPFQRAEMTHALRGASLARRRDRVEHDAAADGVRSLVHRAR